MADKPACLRWLQRQSITGKHSCRSLLQTAAQSALGKTKIDAEAFAEANEVTFWNYLGKEVARLKQLGISEGIVQADQLTRTLDCYPVPQNASPEQQDSALKVRSRPAILKAIDELNDRQYEALGCVVAEALGATQVHLTPKGTEGGVDFYASICREGSTHLFGSPQSPIRVVGQSKLYTHAFGAPGLKEFLQTLSEVKHQGEIKTEQTIPPWFRSSRGAIIGMVIAHSGFQSGADSRAKSHGIVVVDSLQVAEVLALRQDSTKPPKDPVSEMRTRIDELLTPADA